MKNKTMLLIGGAGLLGIVVLYVLSKDKGGSTAGTVQPAQVGDMTVPSYPAPQINAPPLNIVSTPYYQTYNFPQTRDTIPQKTFEGKKPCGCVCDSGIGVGATISPAVAAQIYSGQVARFVASAPTNNETSQFPPSQFPWLYQSPGGHA